MIGFIEPTDIVNLPLQQTDDTPMHYLYKFQQVKRDGRGWYYIYNRNGKFLFSVSTEAEFISIVYLLKRFEFGQEEEVKQLAFSFYEDPEDHILYISDIHRGVVLVVGEAPIEKLPVIESVVRYPIPSQLSDDELNTLRTFFYEDTLDDDAVAGIDKFMKMTDTEKLREGFLWYLDFFFNEKFLETYYDFSIKKEEIYHTE